MPCTVTGCCEPLSSWRVRGEPTWRCLESALSLEIITPSAVRFPRLPVRNLRSNTLPAVAGSTTESVSVEPSTLPMPSSIPLAAATPGSWLACCATSGGRPPPAFEASELMTKSPVNCSLKMVLTELLIDAASTEMPATSDTPIIKAAAVRAVRLGLREAFSRASVPVMPLTLGSGQPTKRATGRAISGPRTKTPMKMAGIPRASIPTCPVRPPASRRGDAEHRDEGAGDEPALGEPVVLHRHLPHGRHRRDPGGGQGRPHRRDHRDEDADDQRHDQGAGEEHHAAGGDVDPHCGQQALQADGQPEPGHDADERGH